MQAAAKKSIKFSHLVHFSFQNFSPKMAIKQKMKHFFSPKVSMKDGSTLQWFHGEGSRRMLREAPSAGHRRTWNAACSMPSGLICG